MEDCKKSDSMPTVGIILTTYNGQAYLRDQMDSLLSQEGVSVHIYAFDDCSQDETLSILAEYEKLFPEKITVRQNTANSGGTGLNIFMNIGNLQLHHDFYAFSDQDDIWLPKKTIRAIEAMKKDRSDLYFSNLLVWTGSGEATGIVRKDSPLQSFDHVFGGGSAGCTYLLSRDFLIHVKSAVEKVDLTKIERISHDWIIYFLARQDGFKVIASPDALIKYRIHENSQYGGMSLGGIRPVIRKIKMLNSGFLQDQVNNSLLFSRPGSEENRILSLFNSGFIPRMTILAKYNFNLVRQRSRFFQLIFAFMIK